jgi:hypothetical protein
MSLLAKQGSQPEKVVERRKLPAPPYKFAKNSYITEFQLGANPDRSGNVDLSWYFHPGDPTTITCYSGVSLGGIHLFGCG